MVYALAGEISAVAATFIRQASQHRSPASQISDRQFELLTTSLAQCSLDAHAVGMKAVGVTEVDQPRILARCQPGKPEPGFLILRAAGQDPPEKAPGTGQPV
jgi:hypothetical protein